jgi:hypothetical protein
MTILTTRRRFIEIIPFGSAALLAACSKSPEPAPVASPKVVEPPPATPAAPAPAVAAVAPPEPVAAVAPPTAVLVDEKDAAAVTLGYVSDATRADKVKFKTYVAGSQCSGCVLYLGKPGDATGGCPLFAGKNVSAKGWCSAWVKKA